MSKAIYGTGKEYSDTAFYDLGREKYKEAISGALIAFALGTSSSVMVFCKYYHDKMVNGEVVGTTVPFLIMYNLAKNYRLEGYNQYTESADTAAQIMVSKRAIIERDVAAYEAYLYDARQIHAGRQVTPAEGLKLVDSMKKVLPVDSPLECLKVPASSTSFEATNAQQHQYYGTVDVGTKAPLLMGEESHDNGKDCCSCVLL